MLKCKRLSELSKDEKVIVEALKQSKAGLLEVSEDGSKIRRDPAIPLPENPDVVSIQMRNYCEKKGKEKVWKFKGSIFLTFKTEDAAKAFVAKEEKYKEETLLKKFQKDYLEEKKKEMEEKKNKYQKKDKKPKSEGADGKEEAEEKQEEVLKDECSVNIDKDGGDIAFITYEKGEAEAKIRFKTEGGAKAPAAAWVAKDKVEIKGMTVVGSLLEGEEEDQFLKDSAHDLKNRRNKNKGQKFGQKRRGGGHHGHGGRGGGDRLKYLAKFDSLLVILHL